MKKVCQYCSRDHTLLKCGSYRRDSAIAQMISDRPLLDKSELAELPKHILRLVVFRRECGTYARIDDKATFIRPRRKLTKPLNKYTKVQLINRLFQVSRDHIEQVRELNREVEKRKESEDVCPICLDSLKNKNVCMSACGHRFCSDCFVKNITTELSRYGTTRCACCRAVM